MTLLALLLPAGRPGTSEAAADRLQLGDIDLVAAQLRVLQVKALCNESAVEVSELAMRVCGGAAFRKESGVERAFRDARAGFVMAPTSDALYEFVGRALVGLPVF